MNLAEFAARHDAEQPEDTTAIVPASGSMASSFGKWLEETETRQAQQAATLAEGFKDRGFDEMAAAHEMARRTREMGGPALPPAMFLGDQLRSTIEMRQAQRTFEEAPAGLIRWSLEDPTNAVLAKGDMANLSMVGALAHDATFAAKSMMKGFPASLRFNAAAQRAAAAAQAPEDREKTFFDILREEAAQIGEPGGALSLDARVIKKLTGLEIDTGAGMDLLSMLPDAAGRYLRSRGEPEGGDAALVAERTAYAKQRLGILQNVMTELADERGRSASYTRFAPTVDKISNDKALTPMQQVVEMTRAIANDPSGGFAYLLSTTAESVPGLAVAALAARVGVSPVAVMGATSYARAETQSFAQVAKDRGFDVNNPEDVFYMFQSPEFVASLTDASQRYSATVALWDAMSGAAAGQALAKSPMGDILLQSIAQGAFGGLGEMAGQLASGQDVNGVEIMLEVLAEFTTAPVEVAAVGARGFGRASGASQALENMRDRRTQKRQNENERRFFDALATASDKSELKAKAPKAYRDAVASMMDGTPTDTVYADAQAVEELLQSGKVNPVEFQQATGLTPEQVAEIAAQGGDVQISTADYAARVAGTPVAQALRDHVRLSPETLSAAELASAEEVDTQQLAAQLAEEVTAGTATFAPDIEAARVRMAEEYTRAGRPAAEVDQVTTMYAAFAQTTADTLGVDHRAFLRRFPLPTVRAGADAVSPALNQTAYHGTPHVFDRFDISRIGTGEGNAAYGWGLYFAQEEAVARNYQQALAPTPKMAVRGEDVPGVRIMSDWGSFVNTMRRGGTIAEAREAQAAALDKRAAAMAKFPDAAEGYRARAAAIRAMADEDIAFEGAGNFYVVDVPENEDLMDWDAPLAAQSELTQARARAAAEKVGVAYDAKMTGQALYRALAGALGGIEQDSYKLASEALRDAGFAGHRYLDAGSRGTIGGPGTRNFVVYSDEAVELLTRNGQTLYQSTALRTGAETLQRYGLDPKKKYTTRQVAAALEARQRAKHGVIARNDKSPAALKKLSKWLAEEVMFEVEQAARNPRASAVGWYTTKTQAAIDAVGEVFPELLGRVDTSLPGVALLGSQQAARDFFTAIIAITSDGAKVQENFRSAVRIYGAFRESGTVAAAEGIGNIRNSYAGNLAILQDIVTQKGPAALRDLLLTELTVSELKKLAKENGIDIGAASKMQADMTVPYAAVAFGPKLGAFYANLMGHTGYLTMDRWWSRTFNRLRGQLLEVPTEAGIARVRQLLIDAGADPADVASDEQVLAATVAPHDAYAAKKFKNGTELEKAANTLYKAAFENLQDVPWGAKDRAFMVEVTKATQAALKKRGVAMTIADIQAVLWYYEKRLYGKLGARQSKDISYEEAAAAAAAEYSAGRSSDADAGRPEEPSGDDGLGLDLGDEQTLYIDNNARALTGLDEEQVEAPRWDFVPFGDELFQSAPPAFRLPDLEKASPGPVPGVREVATAYMQRHGLPIRHQASYVTVDVERAREIARLYDEMPDTPNDPAVRAAYEALARETIEQYKALLELGYTFEWITGKDPYASPREAIIDMQQNRHLWVFPTTEGFGTVNEATSDHPLLQPTEFEIDGRIALVNDLFRIVHDVFGHGSEGASFGARGEENAWQAHVRMFSPLAARAMTTETRGQNSWVNFGPYGEQNRANPAETVFADQKVGLLPAWVSDVGQAQDRPVGEVMGWPTIDDFRFGFSPDLLQRDGWFVITGMREAFGDQSDPRQAEANARLRATMDEMGLEYFPISGMYKGAPQGESYLVAGDPAVGRNLGRAFGQESILTFRGLEYSDGRPDTPQLPAETIVGPGALQSDFYSVMPDGTPWTMGLDWGEPAEGTELFQSAPPVESDAFKAWFGDSKMVDENGAPLVVYHGTNAEFEAFRAEMGGTKNGDMLGRGGVYVTNSLDYAKKFGAKAMPLYAVAANPLDTRDAPDELTGSALKDWAVARGHDGIRAMVGTDKSGARVWQWLLFDPTQVKSVDNRGTFDPNDARILYQSAPPRMYYSPLLEGVRTAKQAKAKGKDWLAILPKLPGVKEAELVFTGALDWLEGLKDDTVTRDEVAAFIEARQVTVEEVRGPGKWERYSEPGAENYREFLLTVPNLHELPISEGAKPFVSNAHYDQPNIVVTARTTDRQIDGRNALFAEEVQSDLSSDWRKAGGGWRERGTPVDRAALEREDLAAGAEYRRLRDELVDALEEFAAEGVDDVAMANSIAAFARVRYAIATNTMPRREDKAIGMDFVNAVTQMSDGSARWELVYAAFVRMQEASKALTEVGPARPYTPFEEAAAYELAVKRLLQRAAQEGYDAFSWTPGYMQARRWDAKYEAGYKAAYDRQIKSAVEKIAKRFGAKVTVGKAEFGSPKPPTRDAFDAALRQYAEDHDYDLSALPGGGLLQQRFETLLRLETRDALEARGEPPTRADTLSRAAAQYGGEDYILIRDALVPPKPAVPEDVWTVEINDAMRAALSQPFPLFQEKRGSIVLPTAEGQRPLLTVFAGSDASTVIHEGAHWFLHVTETLVQSGDAPQRMVDQWKALTDWWRSRAEEIAREAGTDVAHVMAYLDGGAIDSATGRAIWTAIHENTARGFELYASEGKAPTLGLRAAFESFRAWMIAVYRMATLDRALAVQITDEVRLVFDQWLATDEQIAQARATGQVDPAAAAKAGVQQGDLDILAKLALEAQEEAQAYMLGLPGPRMAKRHEWRVARAKALEAARADLAAKPSHQAVAWLTKFRWIGEGETPDYLPAAKIDRQGIVDIYGEEVAAELADMTQVDGIDHDDMAPLFGFDSGDALVQAIRSTPDFTRAVRARATAALRAQQARPTADDIDAATHGDKRGQLLAAELRALRKAATGIPVFTRRQAALIAEQTIRAMPARAAVKSENFLAAERRAGRRVEEAMAKGDMRAAAIAKRDQLMQHSLYNQSRKAAELVEKARRRAKRLQSAGTRKSLAGEYLPAIDQVLEQYDFRKLARGAELDRTRLAAYVKMMTDAGRASELAIPRHVLDEVKRRPYLTLSVAELEGVLDTLVNIEHTARLKNKLRNAQRERDLRATVDAVVAEMDANLPDKPRARVRTQAERMGDALRNYANIALNVETRLRQYGGWRLGAAYDAIKADIDAAGVYEQTLAERRDIELEKLYGLYSRRERIGMARRRRHEALGGEFSQWELISAALNMGNAENMSRLKGRDTNKPFSDAQIEYIQSQLTDKDWDFVEGTWELVDSYWPLIAERERRVTGTIPKKVEAEPLTLPSGRTLRGGYYPIRYDGTLSSAVSEEELQERLQAMQGGRFGKAQTKQGHLEARTGSGGRVLLLDMGVLHQHLTDIIHDLAFAEVTADTWRVLRDPALRDAFQRKGLQPDLEMLEIWVQDVAMGASVGGGWAGRTAMAIKGNFTTSRLAANLSTIVLQLTGYTHSIAVVGAGNMAAGLAQFAANPRGAWLSVLAQSEFMRHKTRLIQPDVAEMRMQSTQSAAIGAKGAMQRVIDLGMAPIQLFQIAVDIPTWIAAQRKALREGVSPEQARRFADRAVVRAQGGTAVADRTAFERGSLSRDTRWNGALRLFATLASFMMTKGNLMREIAGKAATERTVEAAFTGAFHMALIVMIEAMISEAVRGQLFDGDDDDEDPAVALAKKAAAESAKTALGTLPFVRDVASYADGFGGGGGYGAAVETIGKPIKELQQGELDKALFKAINNAVGLATGLPSGQINRIIDAAANSGEDDASFADYLFGVKK